MVTDALKVRQILTIKMVKSFLKLPNKIIKPTLPRIPVDITKTYTFLLNTCTSIRLLKSLFWLLAFSKSPCLKFFLLLVLRETDGTSSSLVSDSFSSRKAGCNKQNEV